MEELSLNVKNMHCKSCEMLICDALQKVGVNGCHIDHKTGNVNVKFNKENIKENQIKKAIINEGFKLS